MDRKTVHYATDRKLNLVGDSGIYEITGNNQNWAMACGLFIAVRNFYCTQAKKRVTCEKCKEKLETPSEGDGCD